MSKYKYKYSPEIKIAEYNANRELKDYDPKREVYINLSRIKSGNA